MKNNLQTMIDLCAQLEISIQIEYDVESNYIRYSFGKISYLVPVSGLSDSDVVNICLKLGKEYSDKVC